MKVELRPIQTGDLEHLYRWRNDLEIMLRTRQWAMLEWERHTSWFKSLDPNKDLMRAINARSDYKGVEHLEKIVGVCGLTNIDWVNRSSEVSIYIGDGAFRRKGVAKEAIRQLKVIAFDQMGLHRLWAEVYSFNVAGQNLFIKCGFGYEGYLRDTVWRGGEYYDSHFYNYLEDTWKALQDEKVNNS